MKPARRTTALLAIALAGGCRQATPPRGPAPAATLRASSLGVTAEDSRTACLSDPKGSTGVDEKLRATQRTARAQPTLPQAWVAIGQQWVRKARLASDSGFYFNAEGCATVAAGLEPEFRGALQLRALAQLNGHAFEQARSLAEAIVARAPDDPIALGIWSDALLELGRYDEATLACERLLNLRPGMAADSRGSYLRWLRGDVAGAARLIRDALVARDASDPEPAAWTFVEAAAIYWHKGDYDGADAIYREALQWVPDYPPALLGRGRVALALGRPLAATQFLERAYRGHALVEIAWLAGDAHAMNGDSEAAEEAYARAVTQGRRGDGLTLALFEATKNRDVDEALRLLAAEREKRAGIYLDDAEAWALYRAGRLVEARQASDRALRLGTRDARLLYHAGAIRIAAGEMGAGRKLVEQALALNPQFDWTGANEARALLAAR